MRDGHNPVAPAGVDDCIPTALDLQRVAFFTTAYGNESLTSFIIGKKKEGEGEGEGGRGGRGMFAMSSS